LISVKFEIDADYIAGYVVMAAIGAIALALLSWMAWNDIGHWQHPRVWISLGTFLILGPIWALRKLRGLKQDD